MRLTNQGESVVLGPFSLYLETSELARNLGAVYTMYTDLGQNHSQKHHGPFAPSPLRLPHLPSVNVDELSMSIKTDWKNITS